MESLTEAPVIGPGAPLKLLELSMLSVLLVSLQVLLPHEMGLAWEMLVGGMQVGGVGHEAGTQDGVLLAMGMQDVDGAQVTGMQEVVTGMYGI